MDRPTIPWLLRGRGRLVATVALGLGLPLGVLALVVSATAGRALRREVEERNLIAARLAAVFLEEHFQGISRYVEAQARRPTFLAAIAARDAAAARECLADVRGIHPTIDRTFFADPDGVLRYDQPHVPEVVGRDFSFRDWYRGVVREDGTYVSEVYRRAAPPRVALVAVATPVRDEDGALLGFLAVQETLETITSQLGRARPDAQGELAVVDHRGRLATQVEGWDAGEEPLDLSQLPAVSAALAGREGSLDGEDPITGRPSLVSHAPVGTIGWAVLARRSSDVVDSPVRQIEAVVAGVSAVCLLAMIGLGIVALDALRRQHVALADLESTKATLVGLLMHDLRNPLTPIFAHVSILRRKLGADPVVAQAVHGLDRSAKALLRMVNNLIDIVRIEDGKMPLARAPHDLGGTVRDVVGDYRPAAEEAGLELALDGPAEPVEFRYDEPVLHRVLENLVTNAIKHTGRGGRVEVRWSAGPSEARLEVADDGEGIAEEHLSRLFQKYGRIESQARGTQHDTGLGLVFCRMAVELHGGRIEVRSRRGEGTTFEVRLPR